MTTRKFSTLSPALLALPILAAAPFAGPAEVAAAPDNAASDVTFTRGNRNTDLEPAFPEQFRADLVEGETETSVELLVGGLVHPWGIDQLPDGSFLVTERPGRLRHVSADGTLHDPIEGLPEVYNQPASPEASVQAGLLDVKIGPDFANDRMVYFTYSKPMEGETTVTAAARGVLSEDMTTLSDVEDIFVQDPPSEAPMHYGSRLVFPGDGTVFITTGEHFTEKYREYAQDLDKTYGKVIRVNLDGSIPEDNPFVGKDGVDSIWSLGHRNIQAADMSPDGRLHIVEHGPAGGDELNRPEPGLNYGWPKVSYGEEYSGEAVGEGRASMEGMEEPLYFWDPVIAPGGMSFVSGEMFPEWEGDMLIGSLYPGGLVRLELDGEGFVAHEERLLRKQGRVRDVDVLQDGSIVFLTDLENGSIMHMTAKE
ncbi:PQQ-dependent sugar dehydrogenase [Profundibacterium mesophilum]|uniref:Glucose dehydrogenase n=1 Tax=Profundibacterium mesophilum KAUST100406-0324 TaxID=1037889 RepID=A0A921NPZ4_9RHOB|nr:PQQ-dependent sugar dehydrogenase [Profundibacterium mesophilum]KAF0675892.1 Glucose dehydrogenase [Profundibacterium mesophilum KAUST100406-0324]